MSWRSSSIVGAVCAALGAGATGAAGEPCDELPRRVNGQSARELRVVWRELGVRSTLFEGEAARSLRVRYQELPRADARQTFLVLDVTDSAEADWQYLIFLRTGGGCRFVGAIDAAAQGGEPPSRRLVPLPAGHAALAVRAAVRTGTGLALHRETWHLLTDKMGGLERAPHAPHPSGPPGKPGAPLDSPPAVGGLERAPHTIGPRLARVLDYPARGHMIGWPSTFDRSFWTRAQARATADGTDEVQIEFTASYTSGSYIYWMPVEPLFTATRTAVYTWKRAERRFVLDPARSDLYDDEIEGIFQDAEEQFLRHNVQELAPLAGRANERQRTWLRHFLDSVADSPEKRAVMENFR